MDLFTFGEREADTVKKHQRSKEEIERLSVEESLNEVDRALYLLRKGSATQRISVLQSLPRHVFNTSVLPPTLSACSSAVSTLDRLLPALSTLLVGGSIGGVSSSMSSGGAGGVIAANLLTSGGSAGLNSSGGESLASEERLAALDALVEVATARGDPGGCSHDVAESGCSICYSLIPPGIIASKIIPILLKYVQLARSAATPGVGVVEIAAASGSLIGNANASGSSNTNSNSTSTNNNTFTASKLSLTSRSGDIALQHATRAILEVIAAGTCSSQSVYSDIAPAAVALASVSNPGGQRFAGAQILCSILINQPVLPSQESNGNTGSSVSNNSNNKSTNSNNSTGPETNFLFFFDSLMALCQDTDSSVRVLMASSLAPIIKALKRSSEDGLQNSVTINANNNVTATAVPTGRTAAPVAGRRSSLVRTATNMGGTLPFARLRERCVEELTELLSDEDNMVKCAAVEAAAVVVSSVDIVVSDFRKNNLLQSLRSVWESMIPSVGSVNVAKEVAGFGVNPSTGAVGVGAGAGTAAEKEEIMRRTLARHVGRLVVSLTTPPQLSLVGKGNGGSASAYYSYAFTPIENIDISSAGGVTPSDGGSGQKGGRRGSVTLNVAGTTSANDTTTAASGRQRRISRQLSSSNAIAGGIMPPQLQSQSSTRGIDVSPPVGNNNANANQDPDSLSGLMTTRLTCLSSLLTFFTSLASHKSDDVRFQCAHSLPGTLLALVLALGPAPAPCASAVAAAASGSLPPVAAVDTNGSGTARNPAVTITSMATVVSTTSLGAGASTKRQSSTGATTISATVPNVTSSSSSALTASASSQSGEALVSSFAAIGYTRDDDMPPSAHSGTTIHSVTGSTTIRQQDLLLLPISNLSASFAVFNSRNSPQPVENSTIQVNPLLIFSFHIRRSLVPLLYKLACDSNPGIRLMIAASIHHITAAFGHTRAARLFTPLLCALLSDPHDDVARRIVETAHIWLPAICAPHPVLRIQTFSAIVPIFFNTAINRPGIHQAWRTQLFILAAIRILAIVFPAPHCMEACLTMLHRYVMNSSKPVRISAMHSLVWFMRFGPTGRIRTQAKEYVLTRCCMSFNGTRDVVGSMLLNLQGASSPLATLVVGTGTMTGNSSGTSSMASTTSATDLTQQSVVNGNFNAPHRTNSSSRPLAGGEISLGPTVSIGNGISVPLEVAVSIILPILLHPSVKVKGKEAEHVLQTVVATIASSNIPPSPGPPGVLSTTTGNIGINFTHPFSSAITGPAWRRELLVEACAASVWLFSRAAVKSMFLQPVLDTARFDPVPAVQLAAIRALPSLRAWMVLPTDSKAIEQICSVLTDVSNKNENPKTSVSETALAALRIITKCDAAVAQSLRCSSSFSKGEGVGLISANASNQARSIVSNFLALPATSISFWDSTPENTKGQNSAFISNSEASDKGLLSFVTSVAPIPTSNATTSGNAPTSLNGVNSVAPVIHGRRRSSISAIAVSSVVRSTNVTAPSFTLGENNSNSSNATPISVLPQKMENVSANIANSSSSRNEIDGPQKTILADEIRTLLALTTAVMSSGDELSSTDNIFPPISTRYSLYSVASNRQTDATSTRSLNPLLPSNIVISLPDTTALIPEFQKMSKRNSDEMMRNADLDTLVKTSTFFKNPFRSSLVGPLPDIPASSFVTGAHTCRRSLPTSSCLSAATIEANVTSNNSARRIISLDDIVGFQTGITSFVLEPISSSRPLGTTLTSTTTSPLAATSAPSFNRITSSVSSSTYTARTSGDCFSPSLTDPPKASGDVWSDLVTSVLQGFDGIMGENADEKRSHHSGPYVSSATSASVTTISAINSNANSSLTPSSTSSISATSAETSVIPGASLSTAGTTTWSLPMSSFGIVANPYGLTMSTHSYHPLQVLCPSPHSIAEELHRINSETILLSAAKAEEEADRKRIPEERKRAAAAAAATAATATSSNSGELSARASAAVATVVSPNISGNSSSELTTPVGVLPASFSVAGWPASLAPAVGAVAMGMTPHVSPFLNPNLESSNITPAVKSSGTVTNGTLPPFGSTLANISPSMLLPHASPITVLNLQFACNGLTAMGGVIISGSGAINNLPIPTGAGGSTPHSSSSSAAAAAAASNGLSTPSISTLPSSVSTGGVASIAISKSSRPALIAPTSSVSSSSMGLLPLVASSTSGNQSASSGSSANTLLSLNSNTGITASTPFTGTNNNTVAIAAAAPAAANLSLLLLSTTSNTAVSQVKNFNVAGNSFISGGIPTFTQILSFPLLTQGLLIHLLLSFHQQLIAQPLLLANIAAATRLALSASSWSSSNYSSNTPHAFQQPSLLLGLNSAISGNSASGDPSNSPHRSPVVISRTPSLHGGHGSHSGLIASNGVVDSVSVLASRLALAGSPTSSSITATSTGGPTVPAGPGTFSSRRTISSLANAGSRLSSNGGVSASLLRGVFPSGASNNYGGVDVGNGGAQPLLASVMEQSSIAKPLTSKTPSITTGASVVPATVNNAFLKRGNEVMNAAQSADGAAVVSSSSSSTPATAAPTGSNNSGNSGTPPRAGLASGLTSSPSSTSTSSATNISAAHQLVRRPTIMM